MENSPQANRLVVLKAVYEASNGQLSEKLVNGQALASGLGMDPKDIYFVLEYWGGQGLIDFYGSFGYKCDVRLKAAGVDYVESIDKPKESNQQSAVIINTGTQIGNFGQSNRSRANASSSLLAKVFSAIKKVFIGG